MLLVITGFDNQQLLCMFFNYSPTIFSNIVYEECSSTFNMNKHNLVLISKVFFKSQNTDKGFLILIYCLSFHFTISIF